MHKLINMKWNLCVMGGVDLCVMGGVDLCVMGGVDLCVMGGVDLCVMGGVDLLVERGGLPGLQQEGTAMVCVMIRLCRGNWRLLSHV